MFSERSMGDMWLRQTSNLTKLSTETHNINTFRIHRKLQLASQGLAYIWDFALWIAIIASQLGILGADFCSTSLLRCVIVIIASHPHLFWGKFFNTNLAAICDLQNVGPMVVWDLAHPHLLKSPTTSSSPMICPSQTWALTFFNFLIWARIRVLFCNVGITMASTFIWS